MLPGLIKSQIPPLSSMVTQCRSPCARGDRKDEAPAAYLQLWLRGKITAEDTQVYATYTDMMEIAFWSRFLFLMNNTLGERNEEWMKARERERKRKLISDFISSVMSCKSLQLCKNWIRIGIKKRLCGSSTIYTFFHTAPLAGSLWLLTVCDTHAYSSIMEAAVGQISNWNGIYFFLK